MNKYMGFFELKDINIPTVPWKEFHTHSTLDSNMLWTLRVAVENSNDLNLPRFVGVRSDEAYRNGVSLLSKYKDNGMVIYYPYFIAKKSGVIEISAHRTVIEAVDKDLWNLVTYGKRDVTLILSEETKEFIGDKDFLVQEELDTLDKYIRIIRGKYRDYLFEGKSIFAEWSFAYNTDVNQKPIGEKYLVFYELRSVN
ncbi:MAG: hypothetical protein N2645_02840 [Clostridia bacterium]|nr:hypothetical protein [Clostridia bacterium]